MRDMGAFESRQNSYKEFSHVSNWLSCYSYDSLYVEFMTRKRQFGNEGYVPCYQKAFS